MTIDLEALEAAFAAATPGPWKACPMEMYIFGGPNEHMVADRLERGEMPNGVVAIRGFGAEKAGHARRGTQIANLKLVEAMHEAMPELIAEIKRLRALERDTKV
jgi:hypothetical protein